MFAANHLLGHTYASNIRLHFSTDSLHRGCMYSVEHSDCSSIPAPHPNTRQEDCGWYGWFISRRFSFPTSFCAFARFGFIDHWWHLPFLSTTGHYHHCSGAIHRQYSNSCVPAGFLYRLASRLGAGCGPFSPHILGGRPNTWAGRSIFAEASAFFGESVVTRVGSLPPE